MILGSHNSWSYLTPKKWWQKLLFFTAKCQRKTIQEQYALGVRCFDLRIRFIDGYPHIVHNSFDYGRLYEVGQLSWLNSKEDVIIRILHDVRKKKDYTRENVRLFQNLCHNLQLTHPNIKYWCGKNLYDWTADYDFPYKPKCLELYSSVCPPKIIDDWIPIVYAKLNNHKNRVKYENLPDSNILLIDFVDIS